MSITDFSLNVFEYTDMNVTIGNTYCAPKKIISSNLFKRGVQKFIIPIMLAQSALNNFFETPIDKLFI